MSLLIAVFNRLIPSVLVCIICLCRVGYAETLMQIKQLDVEIADDYQCQKNINVDLRAKDPSLLIKNSKEMQEIANVIKTYIWLDCENIETITLNGYVNNEAKVHYHGQITKANDWMLAETEKAKEENTKESTQKDNQDNQKEQKNKENSQISKKNTNTSNKPKNNVSKYQNLEQLKSAAKQSSDAMLDLLKGFLSLPHDNNHIEFPQNRQDSIKELTKLVEENNLDALQLLAETYQKYDDEKIDFSLLSKVDGLDINIGESREDVVAKMTLHAAANGSERAIEQLHNQGKNGSSFANYALGMMYINDKNKTMSYDQKFLTKKLNFSSKIAGKGGKGNVKIGLKYMVKSAEQGNKKARSFLEDLGVNFDKTKKTTASYSKGLASNSSNYQSLSESIQQAQSAGSHQNNSAGSSNTLTSSGGGQQSSQQGSNSSSNGQKGGSGTQQASTKSPSRTNPYGLPSDLNGSSGAGGNPANSKIYNSQKDKTGSSEIGEELIID